MKWIPEFKIDNVNEWLNYLNSHNLVRIPNNVVHLVPPFNISINNKIYKEIISIYASQEEKGGLLFASFAKKYTKGSLIY
jgi:hypothetical protein